MKKFFIFLILSQFFIFCSFFYNNSYTILLIWLILFSLLAFLFHIYKIDFSYLFSFIPLFIAFYLSRNDKEINFTSFIFYFLFCLIIFYIYRNNRLYENVNYQNIQNFYNENYFPTFKVFIFTILFSTIILSLLFYIKKVLIFFYNDIISWFICIRGSGTHVNLVFHYKFNDYNRLLVPEIFLFFLLIINFFIYKKNIKNNFLLITILVLLSFLNKLVIAHLSYEGINVIKTKIESKYNCTYYYFAKNYVNNFFEFIKNYTSIYQTGHDNSHLKTHTFLPVFIYWLIIKFISPDPYINGIFIGLLSSLTIIPLFYIIKRLFNNSFIAYFGGLFYLLTPNSSILSIAGIDSIIVLFLALSFWIFLESLYKDNLFLYFLSGFIFGITTYLTFGIWHLLAFFLVYFFIFENKTKEPLNIKFLGKFIIISILFLTGIFLYHLFMFIITKGQFNYIESFLIAKKLHTTIVINNRPYDLWVWVNFIHWSLYASLPLVALFLYRYFLGFNNKINMDSLSLLSLIIFIVQFLSCTSRAEVHRIWMFLIIFIIPIALYPIINKQSKLHLIYANIFTFLIFLNSVLIEIYITDAH